MTDKPRVVNYDLSPGEMDLLLGVHEMRCEFARAMGIDVQDDAVRSLLCIGVEWSVLCKMHGGPEALAKRCLMSGVNISETVQ